MNLLISAKFKMVRAWYFDNAAGEQEESHMTSPPQFIDIAKIQEMTKVQYYKVFYLLIPKYYLGNF